VPEEESVPSAVNVLLVCTGNICRSALGEGLGRAYLREVLGPAAADVHLASAGTRAVRGSRMHPDSALVLSGFGGDPAGFTARQLEPQMIADADLVLTMTREHRREVLGLVPRALSRTFTVREAAALLGVLDGDLPEEEHFGQRVRSFVAALAAARPRRSGGDDDIADPMGRPVQGHQEVGQAVAEALLPVLAALVTTHPQVDGAGVPDPVAMAAHLDWTGARVLAAGDPDDGDTAEGPAPAAPVDGPSSDAQPRSTRRPFAVLGRRRRAGF
jgi:protein-tyrosine-phosphatase